MNITFEQWVEKTMGICKETLTPEEIESIKNIDDEKLANLLIKGFFYQNTPQEMAIILSGEQK